VTISFNLKPGVALGDAVNATTAAAAKLQLPPTIQTEFAGTAQAYEASLSTEPVLVAAALVTVYIILAMLYESLIHPVTIISSLPAASVGALLALMFTRNDLSIIAIIGIILLIGIVKKNAIMMIDFAVEAERHGGKTATEAIYEACLTRFRPIMMTTMAALMGGIPIALGIGQGAEARQPLGLTVVGGLLISQLVTLYITPVFYIYLDQIQRKLYHPAEEKLPAGESI
jgi:multidrug efflux pump subunit AcrB